MNTLIYLINIIFKYSFPPSYLSSLFFHFGIIIYEGFIMETYYHTSKYIHMKFKYSIGNYILSVLPRCNYRNLIYF